MTDAARGFEVLIEQAKKDVLAGRGKSVLNILDLLTKAQESILLEKKQAHHKLVDLWMDRHVNMINALLGVENGIPMFSPDDEIKLATAYRRLAWFGTRGRSLTEVVELPEDFDPFAEEREALKAEIAKLRSR